MTKEELYKVSDILNDILSNYLRGSETEEVLSRFEESISKSDMLQEECNITDIKSRHATGKLKECIDNQTKEGLDKARKQLEEESKAKFKVGDKVMYLNEEYVVTDNKDHYTLRSTKERTSVPVVHIDFGNEDYELSFVEESKKCMYTKDNYTDEDRKVLCDGCEEKCEYAQKEADWLQELHCKLDSLSKEDFEKVWARYHQKEEPISEDLEEAASEYLKQNYDIDNIYEEDDLSIRNTFKAGAQWQKLKLIYKAIIYNDKIYPTTYENEPTEFCLDGGEEVRLITEAVNSGLLKQGDKVKVIIVKDQ